MLRLPRSPSSSTSPPSLAVNLAPLPPPFDQSEDSAPRLLLFGSNVHYPFSWEEPEAVLSSNDPHRPLDLDSLAFEPEPESLGGPLDPKDDGSVEEQQFESSVFIYRYL